jgi:DNA-binding transcriptional LysR family regulator
VSPTGAHWSLYRSFFAVLREGSLSGAARMLGLTLPTIARRDEAPEQGFGLKLFARSQQGLSLTDGALEALCLVARGDIRGNDARRFRTC